VVRERGRYAHLEPEQFAYTLLTGSQRIGHENLRLRDKAYVEASRPGSPEVACRRSRCRRCSRLSRCAASPEEPRRRLADGDVFLRRDGHAGGLPAGALLGAGLGGAAW
jgi:hypothetical protein